MSKYYFNDENKFVIEDYNTLKPFSSFLPGIAGINGIPMWGFYVNRGQGICSFGIKDKDNAIMEFFPADKSYKNVSTNGFRTFIKIIEEKSEKIYEPFMSINESAKINTRMSISPNKLEIEETNREYGLYIHVKYFTVPEDNYAALVRRVTVKNISNKDIKIEVIDGIPEILPAGTKNLEYKELGYTRRAWMDVYNMENLVPYYKLRSDTEDSAEVAVINKGHFYMSLVEENGSAKLLKPIVDSMAIFGHNTFLTDPVNFKRQHIDEILNKEYITTNKVPCGFSALVRKIEAGQDFEICSIIGHASDVSIVNKNISRIVDFDYINKKEQAAGKLVDNLTEDVSTKTSSKLFDFYCRQCYLDNILRGGYPILLGKGDNRVAYHVYSRKHGDLERDYNFFTTAPEYYSQGNGNFRDVNQNRRCDVLFNPEIKDFNIKTFMNLIQADGYNPLSVKGLTFELQKGKSDYLLSFVEQSYKHEVENIFTKQYTPGALMKLLLDNEVKLNISVNEFINEAVSVSTPIFEANFGEGYWIDHWTYNMDLIESYLRIYPENKKQMLFEENSYTYFDSPVNIKPRKDKYVLYNTSVRQFGAIEEDEKKKAYQIKSSCKQLRLKESNEVYKTNLYEKLLCLAVNKFATLDPYGMGIEMEANKPGWNDSLNGLPGLLGSSMPEVFELKRLIEFLVDASKEDIIINIPVEVYYYFTSINECLNEYNLMSEKEGLKDYIDYNYWDKVSTIREGYRNEIKDGFSKNKKEIMISAVKKVLFAFWVKLDKGIQRAMEYGKGIYPTYFYYNAAEYEFLFDENGNKKLNANNLPNVRVTKFELVVMPYYLEGPARAFKVIKDIDEAASLYNNVKKSNLYDKKLKMFKVNESIEGEPYDIGRARAFTPGWLENESIFLHMEYKYILEVLKSGLYDEFFEDMNTVLIPFLNPELYGRSVLENSSFIASSANPDSDLHGTGFIARLSGSTVEFLNMWNIMMAGQRPFYVSDSSLFLSFKPIIPSNLFDEEGKVAFKFLSTCDVTYNNPNRKNTYGKDAAVVKSIVLKTLIGGVIEINNSVIGEPYSKMLREGSITKAEVYME